MSRSRTGASLRSRDPGERFHWLLKWIAKNRGWLRLAPQPYSIQWACHLTHKCNVSADQIVICSGKHRHWIYRITRVHLQHRPGLRYSHYARKPRRYQNVCALKAVAAVAFCPFVPVHPRTDLHFAYLLVQGLATSERALFDRRVLREANSIAIAAETEFREMAATLRLISLAPELGEGNLAEFHRRTQLALKNLGTFVILTDESGQQLLNTRVPFGSPLGKTSNLEALRASLASPRMVVSDVFWRGISKRHVFNVMQALPPGETRARVIITTRNADDLARTIPKTPLAQSSSAAIVDNKGDVVTSFNNTPPAGNRLPILQGTPMPVTDTGILRLPGAEGVMLVHARVGTTDWRAVVWGAAAPSWVLSTWQRLLGAGAILSSLIAASVAWIIFEISRSARALNSMARAVANRQIAGRSAIPNPSVRTDRQHAAIGRCRTKHCGKKT